LSRDAASASGQHPLTKETDHRCLPFVKLVNSNLNCPCSFGKGKNPAVGRDAPGRTSDMGRSQSGSYVPLAPSCGHGGQRGRCQRREKSLVRQIQENSKTSHKPILIFFKIAKRPTRMAQPGEPVQAHPPQEQHMGDHVGGFWECPVDEVLRGFRPACQVGTAPISQKNRPMRKKGKRKRGGLGAKIKTRAE